MHIVSSRGGSDGANIELGGLETAREAFHSPSAERAALPGLPIFQEPSVASGLEYLSDQIPNKHSSRTCEVSWQHQFQLRLRPIVRLILFQIRKKFVAFHATSNSPSSAAQDEYGTSHPIPCFNWFTGFFVNAPLCPRASISAFIKTAEKYARARSGTSSYRRRIDPG